MRNIWLLLCTLLAQVTDAQLVTIPVAVHILWNDPDENLTDSRVIAQIAALNRDFQLQNTDLDLLPFAFSGLVANANIGFCLANIAPDGSQTTGITHTFTPNQAIGSTFNGSGAVFYSNQGGHDAWSTDKYLNIWVSNMNGIEGFGFAPDAVITPTEDGILIDSKVFGNGPETPENRTLGRTLVHEVGHFLGLPHPWGSSDTCSDDDGLADTPTQAGPYFGCPDFPTISCTNSALTHNFMQYTDDSCRLMFTTDQKNRMTQVLSSDRASLTTSDKCTTATANLPKPTKATCRPNPAHNQIEIELPENLQNKTLQLFDAQGQLILTTKAEIIDISQLPTGIYIVKWSFGNLRFAKI